ncbi:MAG: GntR family transcriptional regulator [Candidatus Nanopelagicales bacterium]
MARPFSLDRNSPVPLYFQLSQELERMIRDGDVLPGDRIDTEVELAAKLGLSRPTVRQAIQDLVNKGLLVRRRGVGTQVLHAQMRRSVELTSLYDDLSEAQHRPSTKVLSMTVKPADAKLAETLRIEEGERVIHLKRLRLMDGDPLAIMRNWLPESLLATSKDELETTGLYELMRRNGVTVRIANQRIGAASASMSESRLLSVKPGAPLLVMERTAFDDTGRVVESSSHKYRADSYSFETTLVAR